MYEWSTNEYLLSCDFIDRLRDFIELRSSESRLWCKICLLWKLFFPPKSGMGSCTGKVTFLYYVKAVFKGEIFCTIIGTQYLRRLDGRCLPTVRHHHLGTIIEDSWLVQNVPNAIGTCLNIYPSRAPLTNISRKTYGFLSLVTA